jgi:hypothetical protein
MNIWKGQHMVPERLVTLPANGQLSHGRFGALIGPAYHQSNGGNHAPFVIVTVCEKEPCSCDPNIAMKWRDQAG